MSDDVLISVHNLRKDFGDQVVLDGVSFEIHRGEVIVIIGASGGGKSTLLRCLNLLEQPTSGEIYFKGKNIMDRGFNVDEIRTHIGMVFQNFNLFSNYNVLGNCNLAQMKVLKKTKEEATATSLENLKKVGMADFLTNRVTKLSGGQKQRVAIARALCMKPEIMLFDEPTSALDPEMVGEVLNVIKDLAKEGMTMVIVTHEMNFAKNIATRIIYVADRRIIEDGTPDQVFNCPKNEKTEKFLTSMSIN
jgi:putative lysine transport system ATP-binding protein